jgi:aspartyl protease family protein
VVKVLFNGEHEFEMFFDTGATGTAITKQMLEILGIEPMGYGMFGSASAKKFPAAITQINQVEVGGVVKKNLIAGVLNALDIGLLGQDFYGHYDILIKTDVIELRPR